MSTKILVIDPGRMSDNSLPVKGEVSEDIWNFQKGENIKVAGPLKINAEASVVSEMVLLMGHFEMPFELVCDRCSNPFVHTVKLRSHAITEPLENRAIVDLTNAVREDILLALPAYPHCDADPDAPQCPASEVFPEIDEFVELDEEEDEENKIAPKDGKPNVWDALDNLPTDKES